MGNAVALGPKWAPFHDQLARRRAKLARLVRRAATKIRIDCAKRLSVWKSASNGPVSQENIRPIGKRDANNVCDPSRMKAEGR